MPIQDAAFPRVLARLAQQTLDLERFPDALRSQLDLLRESDVLRGAIPPEFGGTGADSTATMESYMALAEACLTTAFVLTQRNGACQRIAAAATCPARSALLPPLAEGRRFATVGISHLTTSRRHLATPAVAAQPVASGFAITGEAPWVTGAPFADDLVTGATLPDGTQILVVVDMKSPGVRVEPPVPLLALGASQTAAVRFDQVAVPHERLLFGPAPEVMKLGPGGGTGSLATSALAVGATARTLTLLGEEASRRSDLRETHATLSAEREALARDLLAATQRETSSSPTPAETLRQRANSLILRAAQAYLAASKGAGYVTGHPAERAVRESMFFLVWSCPQPVVAAALREFTCRDSWQ